MYGALDISASGMVAQRIRLESISANIAGKDSYGVDANGNPEPYRRRQVHFAPGDPTARTRAGRELGVHVAGIEISDSLPTPKYDPTNPLAHTTGRFKGYVFTSDVNPVIEYINALEASRAYEANVVAAEATKTMMAQALRLLA